jgi:hypothetical protein
MGSESRARVYGGRAEYQTASRSGDLAIGRVVHLRGIRIWRLARKVIHLVAIEPVEEQAPSTANRGLPVASKVIGEADTRGWPDITNVVSVEGDAVLAEKCEPVRGISGTRHVETNVSYRRYGAGTGINGYPLATGRARNVETRCG